MKQRKRAGRESVWRLVCRAAAVSCLAVVAMFVLGFIVPDDSHAAAVTPPNKMNFQGRLTDASGNPLTGTYDMQFKLYSAATGGTLLWAETRTAANSNPVTITSGLFSVRLGEGTLIAPSTQLSAVVAANSTLYFEITVGADAAMTPRSQLATSAYAFNSDTLDGIDSSGFIQAGSTPQTANFNISGTGVAGILQAATFDTASAGTLAIGTTNATSIALNQNVTVATGKSLTLVGGTTANRPASPVEGMMWYDTTTKQLLTYSNGKWQGDSKTATVIVAASNSTQAEKDGAQYVATGSGDQTVINNALTAVAGGKVYLVEGTYTVNGSISVPNNTTLAGAGAGTLITIPNALNATNFYAITNTTASGSGTGITIQDLRLEGNNTNQTNGNMNGIYFNGVGSGTGSSAIQGGKIINVRSNNWYVGSGIYLSSSSNNTLTNNTVQGSANSGISLSSSTNNTITGNTMQGNTSYGINVSSSTNNTITGNTMQGNGMGIYLSSSSNNTLTNNTVQGNVSQGVWIGGTNNSLISSTIQGNGGAGIQLYAATYSIIGSNNLYDNGGSTANDAIKLTNSSNNTITGNGITDSSATTTNYAISINNSASSSNYLAGNTLGSGSINDLGTGTIYGGQVDASGNYVLQPAASIMLQASSVTSGTGVGEAASIINGGSTGSQRLSFATAGSTTWSMGAIGGGTTPSFSIQRYNSGAYVDTPLSISNTTGLVTVSNVQIGSVASQSINFTTGAANHGMEIGRTDGTASTPFIDFHSGTTSTDYDARIIISGGSGVAGGGTLQLQAATTAISSAASVGGSLTLGGNLNFSAANPTISASSYFIAPGGAYFNSGIVYLQAQMQARGGIANDQGDLSLADNVGVSGALSVSGTISGGLITGSNFQTLNGNYQLINGSGSKVGQIWNYDDTHIYMQVGPNGSSKNQIFANTYSCTIGNATSVSCSSDSRLKNIIGAATDNLSKVMQLQPTYYTLKSDSSNQLQLGLIAQNVQTQFPELVNTDSNGYLQLNYGGLVAPLIGAVQEQQSEINGIKASVLDLQASRSSGTSISTSSLDTAPSTALAIGGTNASAVNIGRSTENIVTTITGTTIIKPSSGNNSTAIFQIQNAGASSLFTVDSTNNRLYVGSISGDTTGVTLVLGNKTTNGDPAGVDGAMYYNGYMKVFRCYSDGEWSDCGEHNIDSTWQIEDEFMSGQPVSGDTLSDGAVTWMTGSENWAYMKIGTGGTSGFSYNPTVTGLTTTANHPGLGVFSSASSNVGANIALDGGSDGSLATTQDTTFKTTLHNSHSTGFVERVGLFNYQPNLAAPTSGTWWEADPSVSAYWRYCYNNTVTQVCADSTVPLAGSSAANGWAKLEIRTGRVATSGNNSDVAFYINGSRAANLTGINIQKDGHDAPNITFYNTDTTSKQLAVDYVQARGTISR